MQLSSPATPHPLLPPQPCATSSISAAASRNGIVGVLATTGTLASARFAALLAQYAGSVEIITQGCPGLVEQVERGDLGGADTRRLIQRYTAPLLAAGADTLILGCTHYPFLIPMIREVVGNEIALIETGAAVARQLQRRLLEDLHARLPGTQASVQFWSSGDAEQARRIIPALWDGAIEVLRLPQEFV
jgi:glutamate racemase